ncbi:tetratricopeptide repeat protein, partial [Hymenobacter coccineus]|uniref:tetratricopeptide repeat protein n=1 Tax=Hymenobacter coccineus TaxID=1908235 RepID=UPI000B177EEA
QVPAVPGAPLTEQPGAPSTEQPEDSLAFAPPDTVQDDPPAVRQKLFDAVRLVNRYKDSEALAVYQDVLKISPAHYLALWQAAVLSVKIGARYTDETRKAAYFTAATRYADRALALRPEGGESNYAAALALFSQAGLYRSENRLVAFRDLRSYVFLAVAQRPDLPEAWQLLGRWQYRVGHYNVLERIYSKILLGGVPPGGSVADAMRSLETAIGLDSTRASFYYDLARMYRYQGRRRRAVALLQKAVRLPTFTSEDLTINRLCQQLLEPLQRATTRGARRQQRIRQRAAAAAGAPPAVPVP